MNFAFLAHAAFTFPVKLSLSQSTSLLAFFLFSPHPTKEESEQEAGWVFGCWPGSTPCKMIEVKEVAFICWLKGGSLSQALRIRMSMGSCLSFFDNVGKQNCRYCQELNLEGK